MIINTDETNESHTERQRDENVMKQFLSAELT